MSVRRPPPPPARSWRSTTKSGKDGDLEPGFSLDSWIQATKTLFLETKFRNSVTELPMPLQFQPMIRFEGGRWRRWRGPGFGWIPEARRRRRMRRRERGEDDGIATKGEEGTNRQCLEGDVMPARRRQPENTNSGRVDPLPRWAGKRPPNLYAPEGQQSLPPTTKSKRLGFWKGLE